MKHPRRTQLIRDGGPYTVKSYSDGTLKVYPQWDALDGKPSWRRETEDEINYAGGPGGFSRMGLAEDLERWLNGPHQDDNIDRPLRDSLK